MFHDDPLGIPAAPAVEPPPAVEACLWRVGDVLLGPLLLGVGVIAGMALGVVLSRSGPIDRSDPAMALVFTTETLLVEAWVGVVVLLLAARRGVTLRDLGLRTPPAWGWVILAVVSAYGALAAYYLALFLVESLTGWDLAGLREGNGIPAGIARTPLILTVLGLALVVAAPVGEELFFRGLFYRGLAGLTRPWIGLVVSGVAFSLVHVNLSVALPFAVIGMVFAAVYRASGSLWTSIAAHAIVNGMGFVAYVYGVAP